MSATPILVVDDHPVNLKLLRVLLAGEGYAVRTACDARQALAALAKFHPRLIVLDVQLPGMDGLELARRLKADPATRDIIIVAVTAYAMREDRKKALDAGCDAYVPKPIDTRTLPSVLAECLAVGPRGGRP